MCLRRAALHVAAVPASSQRAGASLPFSTLPRSSSSLAWASVPAWPPWAAWARRWCLPLRGPAPPVRRRSAATALRLAQAAKPPAPGARCLRTRTTGARGARVLRDPADPAPRAAAAKPPTCAWCACRLRTTRPAACGPCTSSTASTRVRDRFGSRGLRACANPLALSAAPAQASWTPTAPRPMRLPRGKRPWRRLATSRK